MIPPNWDLDFHVFVDASDVAVGSVLMQETTAGWFRPVYYASRRLSTAEKNYSVTERECLGMIYSIKKFRHYLLGRRFYFHVDHSALLYLVRQQNLTGRLARWVLLLQEFDFEVIHRPGNQNLVADYLSRLDSGEPPNGINDDLPDAALFGVQQESAGEYLGSVSGATRTADLGDEGIGTDEPVADSLGPTMWTWYEEMLVFLNTGEMPAHLSRDQRVRLAIVRSLPGGIVLQECGRCVVAMCSTQ